MNYSVICVDELWNPNLTWYTHTPKLTNCLRQVGLTIIPNLVFLILIAFEFIFIANSINKPIRLNSYNLTRSLISIVGAFFSLQLLFNYVYEIVGSEHQSHTLGDLLVSITQSLILLATVYHYHRLRGIITSGIIFAITFLLTVCTGIQSLDTLLYNASMYLDYEKDNVNRLFICCFCLFVLSFFTDDAVQAGLKRDKDCLIENIENQYEEVGKEPLASPEEYCSFFSKITFYWYTKLVRLAAKREIKEHEIYQAPKDLNVESATKEFEANYFKELDIIRKKNENSSKQTKFDSWNLSRVMFKTNKNRMFFITFIRLLADFITYTIPILLNLMITFISDPNEPKWHGVFIVIGFIFSTAMKFILTNKAEMESFIVGINIRTCLSNLIFKKTLKLSPKAKNDITFGQIINLYSVDSGKFTEASPAFVLLISSPLNIFLGFYLLYLFLGNAAFVGLAVIAFIMGSQFILTHFDLKYFGIQMKINDERIKLINELLSGIRIIKLYGWERAFKEKIDNERNRQAKYYKRLFFLQMVLSWLFFTLGPVLLFTATIAVYVSLVGSDLTPQKVFVSLTIFNLLDVPIEGIPYLINYLVTCKVSLKRLANFLRQEELDKYITRKYDTKLAIEIKDKSTFVWETKDKNAYENDLDLDAETVENNEEKKKDFELKDIELEIKKNSFTAIIGQVGSGKSSLISAILGDMRLIENESGIKGKVNISDDQDICYVAQQAWIQNASFKNNILFNKPLNQVNYEKVVHVCALEPDLKQFEAGDETEIGEKGINLSGGQKQRVSLARACYSSLSKNNKGQIILFDDPLSAVDAHVGKHLCENVLSSKTGILKDTTRVLVTNQLNQLNDLNVDQIILLKNGKIELKCTYDQLLEMEQKGQLENYNLRLTQNNQTEKLEKDEEQLETKISPKEEKKETSNDKKVLIEKEKREQGRVKFNNYLAYFKYFGFLNLFLITIFKISGNFFQVYSRVYLSEWTQSNLDNGTIDTKTNQEHLVTFSVYTSLQCVSDIAGNFFTALGMISTIKLFHEKLLYKVLRSPQSFFDTTLIGRILQRFSSDISEIDIRLPFAIHSLFNFGMKLFSSIVIIIIEQPNTIIFYVLIFGLYIWLMNLYINSSRQLKRWDSTTRSPVYAHFSETIIGISTIKAYDRVEEFEDQLKSRIEINNRAYYYNAYGMRWLKFYLNMLTNLVLLTITFQFILTKDISAAGKAGLLISYGFALTDNLGFVIRFVSQMEMNAVAVERVEEYCQNEEEDEWIKENNRPPSGWPKEGRIEFENYSTRYRKDTNMVLKNLSFDVDSTAKVGVVGRTGAGKSTIALALFRIIEAAEGRILIDNINIKEIGLHDLRSKLSIIPQDPVLFTGSIRFNLDPFNKNSDDEIYEALEHAHLKDYVNSLEDGIEHKIAEGGENLSVGQRQLICLARALLRKSKILVLDEATASVDFATDELVQKTIRSEFKNCTTITIAHRLNTVLDSTKILVLERGELKEYDRPELLLEDQNSIFFSLALNANIVSN